MQNIPIADCCWPGYSGGCQCDPTERALRAWKDGRLVQPMTADQREWCLSEIASVEGYERREYEQSDTQILAGGVLSAWTDFCRDKGLL